LWVKFSRKGGYFSIGKAAVFDGESLVLSNFYTYCVKFTHIDPGTSLSHCPTAAFFPAFSCISGHSALGTKFATI
jgi:hypothetical protein